MNDRLLNKWMLTGKLATGLQGYKSLFDSNIKLLLAATSFPGFSPNDVIFLEWRPLGENPGNEVAVADRATFAVTID